MVDAHNVSEHALLLRHREIAGLVDRQPELIVKVREIVEAEIASTGGTTGDQLWQLILRRPWAQIRERMLADGHEGRLLRSNSPFAFVAEPSSTDERRALWRRAKAELSAATT